MFDKPLDKDVIARAIINAIQNEEIEGVLEIKDIEKLAKSSIE